MTSFLAEYSQIRVTDGNPKRDIWIHGAQALRIADPGWIEAYEEVLQTVLAPIGAYQVMCIFLGQNGHFYGGFDREFGDLGNSVTEMIERIWYPAGAVFEYQVDD